jgi:hypothetical protein
MDADFMFQLAIDQMVGQISPLLACNPEHPLALQRQENAQLLLLHISGQLQELKAFPTLRSDTS